MEGRFHVFLPELFIAHFIGHVSQLALVSVLTDHMLKHDQRGLFRFEILKRHEAHLAKFTVAKVAGVLEIHGVE